MEDSKPPEAIFLHKVRREVQAGGFPRDDGALQFFSRVNALLKPQMTVIDLGAGRGGAFDRSGYLPDLMRLQGKVARVIGIDVDDAILQHPHLDEAHVVGPTDQWPVGPSSVDMIVADWVLEHISEPSVFASEASRVLKPGGWICARTPNKWGYVGIGARMIPNSLHVRLLKWIWPGRKDVDVFPTEYRLNTRGAVRKHFPKTVWNDHSYVATCMPRYHANSGILFRFLDLYQKLAPEGLCTDMMIFLQKKA